MPYFIKNKIVIAFFLFVVWLIYLMIRSNSFFLYTFWIPTKWEIISSERIIWESHNVINRVSFYIWLEKYEWKTTTSCEEVFWLIKTPCHYNNWDIINIMYSKKKYNNFIIFNNTNKTMTYILFIWAIICIIIAIIMIYLFRKYSKYFSDMKKWKVSVKELSGKIINIIPKWSNKSDIVEKHLLSWYFEVDINTGDPIFSNIYKSDIFEYKGKWITNEQEFINYTNNIIKIWDEIKVYISLNNPDFYYIKEITIPKG